VIEEAALEPVDSGLAPVGPGWFVVDVSEAAWLASEAFGARSVFEGDTPVLRSRPELGVHRFPQLGIALCVLQPGQPSGLYHAESNQEDFLVLAGECLLLIEDAERPLAAGHFVHCPPATAHIGRPDQLPWPGSSRT
jgi:quercetin dioxygenase-like cupin family protein